MTLALNFVASRIEGKFYNLAGHGNLPRSALFLLAVRSRCC